VMLYRVNVLLIDRIETLVDADSEADAIMLAKERCEAPYRCPAKYGKWSSVVQRGPDRYELRGDLFAISKIVKDRAK
jgi:hypothetical protein